MLLKTSFFTAFALVCLSFTTRAKELPPSNSTAAEVIIAFVESALIPKNKHTSDCSAPLVDSINQGYSIWINYTDPRSSTLDHYLNVTRFISDPVARLVRHCPIAVDKQFSGYVKHFD